MEWVILAIGGFIAYAFFKQKKEDSPEARTARLEQAAENMYDTYLNEVYEANKDTMKSLKEDKDDKMGKLFEKDRKETLKSNQEHIEKIGKFRTNIARLKEKMKHGTPQQKLEIATDNYDYINLLYDRRIGFRMWFNSDDEAFSPESKEAQRKINEYFVKTGEIEKRVERMLEA